MIRLMQLTYNTCRWSVDYSEGHWFCGDPTKILRPYCEAHCHLAYGRGTQSERSAHRVSLKDLEG